MSFNVQVSASLRTHKGRVRDHNEDFVSSKEPASKDEEARHGWLYIVADGVGGAEAGEVASQYASERTIEHYLNGRIEDHWGDRLRDAMFAANKDLRQLVTGRGDLSRMATTMVATVIHGDTAFIANVGDSRCYLWRDGTLEQVTKDQSLVAKLVEEGAITEAEAAIHPRKNVILYSLGSENNPQIDLFERGLEPGDMLLLCSDGLNRHVSDEELASIISDDEPNEATKSLVKLANRRGGEDNISAVVLHYHSGQAPVVVPSANGRGRQSARGRALLWTYTGLLSLVQIFLTILVWLLLRIS